MKKKDNIILPQFVTTEANFSGANGYVDWVAQIKQRYQKSQIKARVQVNSAMLEFYWSLGHDIILMQAEQRWGSGVLDNLSKDLKDAFPDEKGFSVRNLQYCKKWVNLYLKDTKQLVSQLQMPDNKQNQNSQQVVDQLISPITEQLVPQLESLAYKLVAELELHWGDYTAEPSSSANNFAEFLPAYQGNLAQELFKDEYNLQFLRGKQIANEKDLEDAIAKDVTSFLLQLGKGFAYVGRQMELRMDAETSYFPDLLFYNIILKSYVVIELKVVEFIPEFAGKLNFYVNACNHLLKGEDNNPTIGLLICSSKNDTKVQWALEGICNPLAVAAHNILPTAEEIKHRIALKRQLNNDSSS